MSFDQQQIAGLIRKLASADQLLAEAYINGTIFANSGDQSLIDSLKKSGILRTADFSDEYRLNGDVKRLIDRLLLRNQRYQKTVDMAKMILSVEEDIEDYRRAIEQNDQEEARYHLEQIDDTLYEALESLENSLAVMFAAITSQFGFVSSLSSKIRQNERALAYAQQLVRELSHINLNDCYSWLDWPASPAELSRKVIRFIDQYKSIVERLASIVDRMKTLLFTLRLREKTANRSRAMAQYLRKHPEWEPLNWCDESVVPALLKRGIGMQLQSGLNTLNPALQPDFAVIIQELRRQAKPLPPLAKVSAAVPLDTDIPAHVDYTRDQYDVHIEELFARAIDSQGYKISALDYWRSEQLELKPALWLDIVFAQYCCLPQRLRQIIAVELEGEKLAGFNGNERIHEIRLQRIV